MFASAGLRLVANLPIACSFVNCFVHFCTDRFDSDSFSRYKSSNSQYNCSRVPPRRERATVMLAEERRFRIREMLSGQRTIAASDLCAALGVTAATIRRDLAALEHDGVLVRSHGGAGSRIERESTRLNSSHL